MTDIPKPDIHRQPIYIEPADPASLEPDASLLDNPTDLEWHVQRTAYSAARNMVENEYLGKRVGAADESLEEARAELHDTARKALELRNERDEARKEAKKNKELAEKATEDELTGVLNRRGLLEAYDTLVRSSKFRRNHVDSILFIDGDEFKAVNTSLGHTGGDEVLKSIARAIKDRIRDTDVVGRYGGDEFVAILTDTNKEDARLIAEEVRQRVEDFRGISHPVTVSIGVDSIDLELSLAESIRHANKAMLDAKNQGRNQVIMVDLDQDNAPT